MKMMYRTGRYGDIEALEVVRETPGTVHYKVRPSYVRRENRVAEGHQWHTSRREALEFLIARARERHDILVGQIHAVKENIATLVAKLEAEP